MTGGAINIPLKDGKSINIPVDRITYDPESNQVKCATVYCIASDGDGTMDLPVRWDVTFRDPLLSLHQKRVTSFYISYSTYFLSEVKK